MGRYIGRFPIYYMEVHLGNKNQLNFKRILALKCLNVKSILSHPSQKSPQQMSKIGFMFT